MKKILNLVDYIIVFTIMICILLFILFPFLKVFVSSFYVNERFSLEGFNFLNSRTDLVFNSVFVAVFVTVLTTFVSTSVGIFCYGIKPVFRKFISFVLMITMISPPFVSSLAYIKLFGRRGFITYDILKLSVDAYGPFGIILMQSIGLISLSSLMIITSLSSIDKAQVDSARSLGAKTHNIIFDILIPELMPSIKVVAVLAFIRSISDFSTPLIIGGTFETLASSSYITFISEGNISKAGAMNVVLCIPVIIMFIFYVKNSKIISKTSHGVRNSEISLNKKNIGFFIISFISFLFLVFLSLQYGSIIMSAFTDYEKGKMYFTLEHFLEIKNYIDKTVFRSIYYSLLAGFFGSLIGLLLQYYICIREKKFLKFFDFFATMPYILPGTFFGIGYILAFNKAPLHITGTALIVILNVTFKQLPFSTKVFNTSMKLIDKNEILSSKDLGANEFFVFKDIVLPHSINDFVISMMNNFNATMTTVGSIIFLVYPSQKVLTLVMFDVINSGKYNVASVIALLIIIICLSFNLLFMGVNRFIIKLKRIH
ncbi:MAG: iron ABC transporter permease [Peptoniphilaceae bacterium]|uniref:ABC transporter permease n=1 Tax=Parvimonas sp. TaxID=1944660 RepID=UPI0025D6C555|nr:iron ABC transporter permease [Parvimonas sp.]MCI5997068.1 iron ABC transporter permease [Parvimonas sp.]MDD7765471.1 iron ABC transporter permease [Peptoniphilaceae bacterium]MDY3051012.1 iron ABC transporter permease [Parvimonas sp.]